MNKNDIFYCGLWNVELWLEETNINKYDLSLTSQGQSNKYENDVKFYMIEYVQKSIEI